MRARWWLHRYLYLIRGRLAPDALSQLASTLANPLINRVSTKTRQEYGETGMNRVVPQVRLHEIPAAGDVDLAIPAAELARLGKEGISDLRTGQRRGPLALDLDQLHTIRDYFDRAGRKPTDVELESLAQTWSEHCKHTNFASPWMMTSQKAFIRPSYRRRQMRSGPRRVSAISASRFLANTSN